MTSRADWREMLSLAAPLIVSELGWIAMGIVDTMFVGRVSAEAIGGVSIGTTVFHTTAGIASGVLLGLDTLVSQAYGAGDHGDGRRSLVNSLWLAIFLTPLVMGTVWLIAPALSAFGVRDAVAGVALPYIRVLNWSAIPLLLYFALRRYLQALGVARPIMVTLIAANLVNVAGNWVFVFGNLGAPRLGAVGSAWSTVASRVFMLAVLAIVAWRRDPTLIRVRWRLDTRRVGELVRLGVPAAGQMGLEYVVWTTATVLAGRFPAEVLAGHQVALMTVTATFMMPFGVSSAAAVLVGQAIGRGDPRGAASAGWAALSLGSVIMSITALILLTVPEAIAKLFAPEPAIVGAAAPLLRMAALFQLFDGFQVVATGALRGIGDTRTPMLCHFAGYWVVGLPLGIWLGFGLSMGALGLWAGLSLGVIAIGIVLLAVWRRAARKISTPA